MEKNLCIGAHVGVSGGLQSALNRAVSIGAQCIQIFGSSPQQWKVTYPKKEHVDIFLKKRKETGIEKVYLHAAYIANLASGNPETRKKSLENLKGHFEIAHILQAQGLIFHIGSHTKIEREKGIDFVVKGVKEILKSVKGGTHIILENSSGGGGKLGDTLEEIGVIYKKINSRRVRVCIDTAHAFEAGIIDYTPQGIKKFFDACDTYIGIENISVLHVNDSKTQKGSYHDRHENIGRGEIGLTGFQNLAQEKRVWNMDLLLEVPGFEGVGPDKKNIEILRSCF